MQPRSLSIIDLDHSDRIWQLVDFNRDGKLSLEEYATARFLISEKVERGRNLPKEIPDYLLPQGTATMEKDD